MRSICAQAIAVVPQKALLFSAAPLRTTSAGERDASEEETLQAGGEAACADRISSGLPPMATDTVLGQGGVNLSGGQKQRLCLARALLRRPKHPDSGRLHQRSGCRHGGHRAGGAPAAGR
jgi:ATP-binding cassette subfamily B protein